MPRPLLLILDFDSTLTLRSTLPFFLSVPTRVHTTSPSIAPNPPPTASELSNLYTTAVESHPIGSLESPSPRKILSQEITYQNSLRPLELASFRRGCSAFQSVRVSDTHISNAAQQALDTAKIKMRQGWLRALTTVLHHDGKQQQQPPPDKVAILSVAWSPHWIRSLLNAAVRQEQQALPLSHSEKHQLLDMIDGLLIQCNDVQATPAPSDEVGESGIYVSSDKLRILDELREAYEDVNGGEHLAWTVYVGDSLTDLECLLAAHVGIIMRDEETMGSEQRALEDSLARLDIATYWIGDFGQIQTAEGLVLWWARDFDEVVDCGCLDLSDKILN